MQKLILSNNRLVFETEVNRLLEDGATVVPKTLTISTTATGDYAKSEYAVVLELPATLARTV